MSRTLTPATLAPGEAGLAGWLRPTRLPTLVTVLVSGAVCAASAVTRIRLLMVVSSVAAVLSQVSWWGATAVGFVNAH